MNDLKMQAKTLMTFVIWPDLLYFRTPLLHLKIFRDIVFTFLKKNQESLYMQLLTFRFFEAENHH